MPETKSHPSRCVRKAVVWSYPVSTCFLSIAFCFSLFPASVPAADGQEPKQADNAKVAKNDTLREPGPKPTLADVAYGPESQQKLDFWKADSTRPTPLLFYVHGGGWNGNDKSLIYSQYASGFELEKFLTAGISVVSVGYRFVPQAQAAGVKPPVSWPLHDAARALQFVRSKAAEWNIDKLRVAASGGSAGGCTSLWLAFHDEMADPLNSDPVLRESTRLMCAAVYIAQTSLDPQQLKEWIPNSVFGGHAFGFVPEGKPGDQAAAFQMFLAGREQILPWIKEYSPYELVTADDPSIHLFYRTKPALGQQEKDPTHSANFGVKLQAKLRSVHVECELVYPGASDVRYRSIEEVLIPKLKANARTQRAEEAP